MAFLFDRIQKLKLLFNKNYNWKSYYTKLYEDSNPALEQNRKAIESLIKYCQQENKPLLMVNIPELHELKEYPFPFATDFVQNIASNHQVPFLDLQPVLQTNEPQQWWVSFEDAHANEAANLLITNAIEHKLKQIGYVQ